MFTFFRSGRPFLFVTTATKQLLLFFFFFKQLNTALVFISLPLSVYVCASCLCVVTHASLIALLS